MFLSYRTVKSSGRVKFAWIGVLRPRFPRELCPKTRKTKPFQDRSRVRFLSFSLPAWLRCLWHASRDFYRSFPCPKTYGASVSPAVAVAFSPSALFTAYSLSEDVRCLFPLRLRSSRARFPVYSPSAARFLSSEDSARALLPFGYSRALHFFITLG